MSILHKDLKSDNVLIANNVCKLADFGLANEVFETLNKNNNNSNKYNNYKTELFDSNSINGTLTYIAPEISMCSRGSFYTDIYSYGIILWEIFTTFTLQQYEFPYGKMFHPTTTVNELFERVCEGKRPNLVKSFPNRVKQLYLSCVDPDPKKRPLCDEILSEVCNWQLDCDKDWDLLDIPTDIELASINTITLDFDFNDEVSG
jgi:serine/threonine protein kinase